MLLVEIAIFFVFCCALLAIEAAKNPVFIGGIFSPEAKSKIEAFQLAVKSVNADSSLLKDVTIRGLVETAEKEDEFANLEKAITLARKGALAIVGPLSVLAFEATQRLCQQLDVAQVAIQVSGLSPINPCDNDYVLRMSPSDSPQLKGIVVFIKHFQWRRVALIASHDKSGREGVEDFKHHLKANDITLTTSEYFDTHSMEYAENHTTSYLESMLNKVKRSGARVIVLKVSADDTNVVLEQAWRLGMTENHAWILTDSTLSEVLALSNRSLPVYLTGVIGFRQGVGKGLKGDSIRLLWKQSGNTNTITPSAGRVFDAVRVLASGIQMAIESGLPLDNHLPAKDICNNTFNNKSEDRGKKLSRFLRKVHTAGFMSHLSFDTKGFHKEAIYDVINIQGNKFKKVGSWSSFGGLQINKQQIIWPSNTTDVPREIVNALKNKNIRVVTFVVSKPAMAAKNKLSFLNSLWCSTAYYLGQGPDGNHPVSGSGRVSVAVWWFCITILGATYTANLAAYLTTNRMQTPIRDVEDLVQQTSTEYGVVKDSQTERFFATSVIARYQMMWEFMKLRQTLQSSTSEGLSRVGLGKFAFIHDQPLLLYKSRKEYCAKMKVLEGTFGESLYGFALPTNSPYTTLLSVEILELRNKGEVSRLIDKWMIDETPCKELDEDNNTDDADTSSMGVVNMLGVFIFMLAGIIAGGFILIIEWTIAAFNDIDRWNPEAPHTFLSALARRLSPSCNNTKREMFIKYDYSHKKPPSSSSKSKLEYKLSSGRCGSTEL